MLKLQNGKIQLALTFKPLPSSLIFHGQDFQWIY